MTRRCADEQRCFHRGRQQCSTAQLVVSLTNEVIAEKIGYIELIINKIEKLCYKTFGNFKKLL